MSYCVYAWINPITKTPFYIGKGKIQYNKSGIKRCDRSKAKHYHSSCENFRKQLHEQGYTDNEIIHILKDDLTEYDAYVIESCLVEYYKPVKRGGILLNSAEAKNKAFAKFVDFYGIADILVEAYKSGLSINDLKNEYQTSFRAIRDIINNKCEIRQPGWIKTNVDPDKIITRYTQQLSSKQIAKELNTSPSNVLLVLKKNNIKRRPSYNKLLTPKDVSDVLECYKSGTSIAMLAAKYNTSTTTIRKYCRKNNCQMVGRVCIINTPEQIARINSLYSQGYTIKEIGTLFNTSNDTIRRTLMANNIPIRRRGEAARQEIARLKNIAAKQIDVHF